MKIQRGALFPIFIFILICAAFASAAWTLAISDAMFAQAAPIPTREIAFGSAFLPKPTYTPTPLPTFTPQPTSTPAYAGAEIIEEPPAPNLPAYSGNKTILVDISEQHMYVYEGEMLVYSFVASTGMNNATRVGSFSVLNKIPNAYGSTWNIWMPNWLGIYWAGSLQNGIHALPIMSNGATLWSGYLGVPISYGCVVLGSYEAQLLYDWSEIGTPVDIQW